MTWDEAIERLYGVISTDQRKNFVGGLIALGLLKLNEQDEQPKQEASKPTAETMIREMIEDWANLPSSNITMDIINNLLKAKYKIVDTELYDIVDKRQAANDHWQQTYIGEQVYIELEKVGSCYITGNKFRVRGRLNQITKEDKI